MIKYTLEEVVGKSVNDHYYTDISQLFCHFWAGDTTLSVAIAHVKTWF